MFTAMKNMRKPDIRLEITVSPEVLKISEELAEKVATKLALVSGLDWDATKENLDRTLGVFSRLGSSTNAHKTEVKSMDLIIPGIVGNSQGGMIADTLLDSIECKDGVMEIATQEPKTAADINLIASEGKTPEVTTTKISKKLTSNVYRNGEPYLSREEFFGLDN